MQNIKTALSPIPKKRIKVSALESIALSKLSSSIPVNGNLSKRIPYCLKRLNNKFESPKYWNSRIMHSCVSTGDLSINNNTSQTHNISMHSTECSAPMQSTSQSRILFDASEFSSIDKLISRNPSIDYALLFRYINICTRSGSKYSGYVYTIDPVSRTFALINDGVLSMIPGINIESISINKDKPISDCEALQSMLQLQSSTDEPAVNNEKTLRRRDQLVDWLKSGKVPTRLDDKDPLTIIVGYEALEIKPPYLTENFHSSSVTILSKMIKICNSMPKSE